MGTLERYLEVVPLPVIILMLIGGITIVVFTPARARLPFALTVMPTWLLFGRLESLGAVSMAAKATGFVILCYVGLSAFLASPNRRQINQMLYLLPICGLLTVFWAPRAYEPSLYASLAVQWSAMLAAAVLLVQHIQTWEQARRTFFWLTIGFSIGSLVLGSTFIRTPGEIFRLGLGRFEPYGAQANFIVPIMVFTTPAAAYFGLRSKRVFAKVAFLSVGALSLYMSLLTASRSAVFPIAFTLLVLLWEFRKSAISLTLSAIIGGGALVMGASLLGEASLDRVKSLESERFETFQAYGVEIAREPIVGRLLSRPAELPDGYHPHNAYIQILYEYGLVLGGPLCLFIGIAFLNSFKLYRQRFDLGVDKSFIVLLIAVMFAALFHGLTTIGIIYPTYGWAFIFWFLVCLFISPPPAPLAGSSVAQPVPLPNPSPSDPIHADVASTELGSMQPSAHTDPNTGLKKNWSEM